MRGSSGGEGKPPKGPRPSVRHQEAAPLPGPEFGLRGRPRMRTLVPVRALWCLRSGSGLLSQKEFALVPQSCDDHRASISLLERRGHCDSEDEQVCTRLQTREEQREVPAPVS